jgi:ParB-like chromosome segregation protein Spo0J
MKIVKKRLWDVKMAEYNPRIMSAEERKKLRNSIVNFGYVDPIIYNVRHENRVVGGHQRLDVLRELAKEDPSKWDIEYDMAEVDLDLEQEKALNLALNRISGDWDKSKLASLLQEFDCAKIDVSLTGFDMKEVEKLLKVPPLKGIEGYEMKWEKDNYYRMSLEFDRKDEPMLKQYIKQYGKKRLAEIIVEHVKEEAGDS